MSKKNEEKKQQEQTPTQQTMGHREAGEIELQALAAINQAGNNLGELIIALGMIMDVAPPQGMELPPDLLASVQALKAEGAKVDLRWLALARTELQTGFMFLRRAILRPAVF